MFTLTGTYQGERMLLSFIYHDEERLVDPLSIRINRRGKVALLAREILTGAIKTFYFDKMETLTPIPL